MKTAVEYTALSFNNDALLDKEEWCSCYHCCKVFETSRITEIISEKDGGGTCLCPYCWVDSLLPGKVGEEELKYASDICFGRTYE